MMTYSACNNAMCLHFKKIVDVVKLFVNHYRKSIMCIFLLCGKFRFVEHSFVKLFWEFYLLFFEKQLQLLRRVQTFDLIFNNIMWRTHKQAFCKHIINVLHLLEWSEKEAKDIRVSKAKRLKVFLSSVIVLF